MNACVPVEPPPFKGSWIALIARDNCTFVEKVFVTIVQLYPGLKF